MSRNRWWTLIAVLALAPLAVRSRAGAPECPKEKCLSRCPQKTSHKLIEKSYPVAGLVQTLSEGPAGSRGTELLIRAITSAVKPETWSNRGGCGTIEYCLEGKSLIVNQTAGVHERVEAVLKALAAIQPKQPARINPITPAVYSSPSAHLKQYGHFVLDNVKVNAMGVSCSIKRVRFMYKGDGFNPEVAKSVLPLYTPCESVCPERALTGGVGIPAIPVVPCQAEQPRTAGTLVGGAAVGAIVDKHQAEQPKSDAKVEKGKAKPE